MTREDRQQYNVATWLFLLKVNSVLKLPVFGLVDCDPGRLKLLSFYKKLFDVKWLGIRPSDLVKYNIPEMRRLKMTEKDIAACKGLLEDEEFVRDNSGWVDELNLMVEMKQKLELGAMSASFIGFLANYIVPSKLQELDSL